MKNMNVSIVHGRNDHVCLPTAAWRFHNGLLAAGVNTRLWYEILFFFFFLFLFLFLCLNIFMYIYLFFLLFFLFKICFFFFSWLGLLMEMVTQTVNLELGVLSRLKLIALERLKRQMNILKYHKNNNYNNNMDKF